MNLKDYFGFSDVSGTPQQVRLAVGVISVMVGKELGEKNLDFDSLKSRLNHDMEEKGIVAVCRLGAPVGVHKRYQSLSHPCCGFIRISV